MATMLIIIADMLSLLVLAGGWLSTDQGGDSLRQNPLGYILMAAGLVLVIGLTIILWCIAQSW